MRSGVQQRAAPVGTVASRDKPQTGVSDYFDGSVKRSVAGDFELDELEMPFTDLTNEVDGAASNTFVPPASREATGT